MVRLLIPFHCLFAFVICSAIASRQTRLSGFADSCKKIKKMKQKDILEAHRFHRFTQIFRPLCILRLTSPTMHPGPCTFHLTPLNHSPLNHSTPALRFPTPNPAPLSQHFSYFHNHNTQKHNSIKPQSRIFAYEKVPARQCSNTLPACTLFQNTNFR